MTDEQAGRSASKIGWVDDIEQVTLGNSTFRTVVYTATHAQLTVMRLGRGEEIGWESHGHLDQFLRIEQGQARHSPPSRRQSVAHVERTSTGLVFKCPACGHRWSWEPQGTKPGNDR